eukprot:TRINITY_DN6522_c0_g1_i4.p3 TRINITY_DN6522_c0_g1~~TRINITY_DN6522_c0_g1_i4.p3  ORF type:complete len:102 (-),score=7.18 TRINITY_DN6522_c0_g1_i4:171-476(-)
MKILGQNSVLHDHSAVKTHYQHPAVTCDACQTMEALDCVSVTLSCLRHQIKKQDQWCLQVVMDLGLLQPASAAVVEARLRTTSNAALLQLKTTFLTRVFLA